MRRSTEVPPTPKLNWKIIRTLLPFVAFYKGRATIALIFLLLAKFATVSVPLVLREIVNQLDSTLQPEVVLPVALLIAYGALRLSSSLFRELQDTIFSRVRHGIMRRIAIKVVDHLHGLSLRFHLDRQTGAIARDISRGTNSLSTLLNYLLFNIVPTLLEISLVVAIVFSQYDSRFSMIILATFIAYVALTLLFTEWRMKFRVAMNSNESKANSHAIDGLINYETVQFFGNANYEVNRYDNMLKDWEGAAVKSQSTLSLLNAAQGTVIAIGVTLLMLLAGSEVVDGQMTIGDLVAINAFLLQLFIPLGFLGTVYSILKHSLVDMERMFELMQLKPEIADQPDARELQVNDGRIRFENVSFHYEDNRPILFDVNFTVEPGAKIAIVGPSGAGKSTISRLLFRFYDVTKGRITIDGQDIRDVTQ